MAYWKVNDRKGSETTITPGDGENQYGTPFSIKESESRRSLNLSSREYPAMSTRPGRALVFSPLLVPNGIGSRDNQYVHVLDVGTWKRWDGAVFQTVQAGLSSARANFIDFATGTTKYTIMTNGTDRYSWDGSIAANLTNFPLTRLAASHKGRVYALIGRELKFSALNLINDWTTVNDAGSITITKATSDGAAICEYADHVVVLTGSSMHELHGTGPQNYQLIDIPDEDGCGAERTLTEAGGFLYWLDSKKQFKAYDGSMPVTISQKVQNYLAGIPATYKYKCCCGKLRKYLYLSIPYGDTAIENNLLLEYDTELKQWYPQSGSFVDFVTVGEKLYGVDAAGVTWDMENGTTDNGAAIAWFKETGPISKQLVRSKKTLSDIYAVIALAAGASMQISTSSTMDVDDFITRKSFANLVAVSSLRTKIDPSVLSKVDWYRLKFSGSGPCTIHAIEQYFSVKAR